MAKGRFRFDQDTGEFVPIQDERGREILDPEPVALPVRAKTPLPLAEQVARLVRSAEWERELRKSNAETFAEADDFDVDDDFDPSTPYETEFDPFLGQEITPADFANPEKREHYRRLYLVAERNAQRAEEQQRVMDEAYRRYYRQDKKREAAEGAAPGSKSGS